MNFDELQKQWQNEDISIPEISLENQRKISNPLEKIRKNMKMEFWSTFIIIIFLIFIFYFKIPNIKLKTYTLTLVIAMLFITAVYFKKFFLLYKDLQNYGLNTKESLKDLIFQFELNKQYYLGYYLSFVPVLVCEVILIFEFSPNIRIEGDNLVYSLIFLAFILGSLILFSAIGYVWFNHYYGRYIKKVKNILNELQ